jgi:hypothetical protein
MALYCICVMADWSVGVKNEAPSAVVAVIFELVREKNTDQTEFRVLVKKIAWSIWTRT